MKLLKRLTMVTKPFSLNKSTQNVGNHRSCTKGYRLWKRELGAEISAQLIPNLKVVAGKYQIIIEVGRKATKADIDNLIKPIVDVMVNLKVTPDDRNMEAVCIYRIEGKISYIEIYGEDQGDG